MLIVQLIAFIMHFIMAIVVVSVSFQCRSERYTNKGTYMLPMQCPSNQTQSYCFREALPWADDEPLKNHAWNPFMMVVVFEFISAGFALFYLREQRQWPMPFQLFCRYFPLAWIGIGYILYLAWYFQRAQSNWNEVLVVSVSILASMVTLLRFDSWRDWFAGEVSRGLSHFFNRRFSLTYRHGVSWHIPIRLSTEGLHDDAEAMLRLSQRLSILLRFAEYCITASLLYIAVLSLFVVAPPSWAFLVGFLGIFLCNLLGLPLQLTQAVLSDWSILWSEQPLVPTSDEQDAMDEVYRVHQLPNLNRPILIPMRPVPPLITSDFTPKKTFGLRQAAAAFLGAGKWREVWVAKLWYLETSWFGLLAGMLVIIYFGRGFLFNTVAPTFVVFSLWNLILLYCLFGFVGTYFYVDDSRFQWFEVALDILSLSAKIPVAISVCVGFLQMPGGSC